MAGRMDEPMLEKVPSEDRERKASEMPDMAESGDSGVPGLLQKVFCLAKPPDAKYTLALSMGFFITIFYVPVCSQRVHNFFFPPDCGIAITEKHASITEQCRSACHHHCRQKFNVTWVDDKCTGCNVRDTCWDTCTTTADYDSPNFCKQWPEAMKSNYEPPMFCLGYDTMSAERKEIFKDREPSDGFNLPAKISSPDIEGYWPNVVQLMFFTVYQNPATSAATGSTVQLSIQAVAGTLAANMNIGFLAHLFPVGAKCKTKAAEPAMSGLRLFCDEYEDENYGKYGFYVVWADFIIYTFLILASGAGEGTMKFGLSWHMFYTMAFMGYGGYTKSHAVVFTSGCGVILAILVTCIPAKKKGKWTLNSLAMDNLPTYSDAICEKVQHATDESIDYMCFITDKRSSNVAGNAKAMSQRFQIEASIEAVPTILTNLGSDYGDAYFEKWAGHMLRRSADFNDKYGDAALCIDLFSDSIGGIDDCLNLIKKAIKADGEIDVARKLEDRVGMEKLNRERESLKGPMKNLGKATHELLVELMKPGDISANEVLKRQDAVKKCIIEVREKYNDLPPVSDYHGDDCPGALSKHTRTAFRMNFSLYVFATICLGHKSIERADKAVKDQDDEGKDDTNPHVRRCKGVLEWVRSTWFQKVPSSDPGAEKQKELFLGKFFTDREKTAFAIRNFLSITICFWMGNYLQTGVFTGFNPALAGTLAVLISHFPGSAFYKNLMRLLGISLGKVLPIIVMAMISVIGRKGLAVTVAHLFGVWAYESFFALMYYTSPEWSYLGCLSAGFGCYALVGVDVDTWGADVFSLRYKEIGSVTAAIIVQITIDLLDTWARSQFPRDVVVENIRSVIIGSAKDGSSNDGLIGAYEMIDQQRFGEIVAILKRVKPIMDGQAAMLAECKEKTEVVRGPRLPFKFDLYVACTKDINRLIGELEILSLVWDYRNKLEELCAGDDQHEENIIKGFDWTNVFNTLKVDDFAAPIRVALKGFVHALMVEEDVIKIALPADKTTDTKVDAAQLKQAVNMGMLFDVVAKLLPDARSHALNIEHELYGNGFKFKFEDV